MKITKKQLKQIIKEELDKNYHLGKYQPGWATILNIDFRNLKDVGENMPGGVDPNKISKLIVQAFYDNNADYFLHMPFSRRDKEYPSVRVNSKGGGGYIDPSQSKYQVFLNFPDEVQHEDFKTEELDLIMQQINQAAADYGMKLRQFPLRDATTGKLFENKIKVTKAKLQKIIKEETQSLVDEGFLDWFRKKQEPGDEGETGVGPDPQKLKAMRGEIEGLKEAVLDQSFELGRHIWSVWKFGSARPDGLPMTGAGMCKSVSGEVPRECKDLGEIRYAFQTDDVWYDALMHNENLSVRIHAEVYQAFKRYIEKNMPDPNEDVVAAVEFLKNLLEKIDHDIELVGKYTDQFTKASEEARRKMQKFYAEWEEELEWRGGDVRPTRQKSASLFENNVTALQLNQIIKEEISKVLKKDMEE